MRRRQKDGSGQLAETQGRAPGSVQALLTQETMAILGKENPVACKFLFVFCTWPGFGVSTMLAS